jgi:hypothetical protein
MEYLQGLSKDLRIKPFQELCEDGTNFEKI